ncbi:MAG: glycoside hydrolase family 92 protein [Bacteroidia bacterium]|nr:glycoside hydrolase family 92 protein [Bacteroidia bacterium]
MPATLITTKVNRFSIYLILFLTGLYNHLYAQVDYAKMVNPFIGTGGHGHTFPGPVAPFGMVQVGPDTRVDGSWDGCSGYHYSDSMIYGFSHTHLSGTGCSDYGDILLMPLMGEASFDNKVYRSNFTHATEKAKAGSYKVHLNDDDIDVELTTTTRIGFHKYTFNKSGKVNLILDLMHRDKLLDGNIKIIDSNTIEGYRRSEAWARDQRVYFRISFSKAHVKHKIHTALNLMQTGSAFEFDVKKGETIYVKVAISGVDTEGAKKNMDAELPGWNFEKCKKDCEALWNKELNKIKVKGGTPDEQVMFYTALYHCFIHPSIYNDADGRYLGRDFKIHKTDGFNYYTVFSLWDTFRALHPLFNLVQRERNVDFIKTFLEQYKQVGRLPVWELSSNETECMIGYHAVSVIADAYAKGNKNFDTKLAMEACLNATRYDKSGIPAFHSKGFLEVEDESESVSKTLEYAYDDWCVEKFVVKETVEQALKTQTFLKEAITYNTLQLNYAKGWRNLLDSQTQFMRPRSNGGFYAPFNPGEVNNNYTEANAWQYSMFVPHQINELKQALGGDAKFEQKIDGLFTTSSKIEGRQQADITGMIGQYAHGNEPSHHMAYLYNYVNKPAKTQLRVNQILSELYHNAPAGLSGNEDCGQMSAWYVMSAMGFYPVCPGEDNYAVTGSLFDEVRFKYNNKNVVMKHVRENKNNIYISKVNTNHNFNVSPAILKQATMVWNAPFENTNDRDSIVSYEFYYASIPENKIVRTLNNNPETTLPEHEDFIYTQLLSPVITANKKSFKDSLLIRIKTINDFYTEIFVRENNTIKHLEKTGKNDLSFYIYNSSEIEVKSYKNFANHPMGKSFEDSASVIARFYKIPHSWSIQLISKYNMQYTGGGDEGLIDGIRGDEEWRKGGWQGYQYQNFEAVLDLKQIKEISTFSSTYLQEQRAWILLPTEVEYFVSTDGITYQSAGIVKHTVEPKNEKTIIENMKLQLNKLVSARYVKVKAINFGKLPAWHAGSGDEAFIFIDEIDVK